MDKLKMYEYPKCSTCRLAKKFLDEHNVSYETQHIVDHPPTKEALKQLLDNSGLPIKKFFNTSGQVYREQGIKDKISQLSEDELLALLASEGKLIKRPIVTDGRRVTVGFNEDVFRQTWL